MAAYISVPRDLTRVKSKVFFNLTKRQLVCFGAAVLIGVPLFYLLRFYGVAQILRTVLVRYLHLSPSFDLSGVLVYAINLPLFFLALYEQNGQPLEKLLAHYFRAQFFRPKIRPYRTNNTYALLMKGGVTLDPVLEKER